jgi:hypothetical protein
VFQYWRRRRWDDDAPSNPSRVRNGPRTLGYTGHARHKIGVVFQISGGGVISLDGKTRTGSRDRRSQNGSYCISVESGDRSDSRYRYDAINTGVDRNDYEDSRSMGTQE